MLCIEVYTTVLDFLDRTTIGDTMGAVDIQPFEFSASQGVGRIVQSSGSFKKGQRVLAAPWPHGTWQQYTAVAEKSLVSAAPCCLPCAADLADK